MYIFPDKNNEYLNDEVDLRLSELTAQGLIKSEDEYKRVVQDTLHNIDFDLQRITDVKKYMVKKDDTVSSKQLNQLFIDLTADIRVLHRELSDIHRMIDLTFERNQLFYRRMKNRIAAIWKEIQHFRENSFNIESSTYTFFESFSENSVMYLTGLGIDKKTGTLVLQPAYVDSFSDASEVAGVEMTIYPAANIDGGVVDTTNAKNTFEYNFTKGDHTLLKDGLWKVQMLTADLPEIVLDVFNRGTNLRYRGLVATVDISFVNQKLINEINIDPYGDFTTRIINVCYKAQDSDAEWTNVVDEEGNVITAADVDWIRLRNFIPVSTKQLRIIFHQPNFQIIQRLMNKVDGMVDKMVTALVEQRFDKINYSYKTTDQFPKYDTSEEADLYDEVMHIIEEGGDISTLETQIRDLLIPPPIGIKADIRNWKLFNLGAWSIDPRSVAYPSHAVGIYISHDPRDHQSGFKMNNGCPMYAKLYTKQSEPSVASIEWSLMADIDGTNYVEIPILPNNDMWRNESIVYDDYIPLMNGTRTQTYRNTSKMFKLDFPIHPAYQSNIFILENGKQVKVEDLLTMDIYNSSEIYIPTSELTDGSIYSIKYVPAVIDTVRCWTIKPSIIPGDGLVDAGQLCVFATRAAAEEMIKVLSEANLNNKPSYINVSNSYVVTSQLCTRKEYDQWFQNGVVDTFIDVIVLGTGGDWITPSVSYNTQITKTSWLFNSSYPTPYSENLSDLYTWNSLLSAVPSIKVKRKQY